MRPTGPFVCTMSNIRFIATWNLAVLLTWEAMLIYPGANVGRIQTNLEIQSKIHLQLFYFGLTWCLSHRLLNCWWLKVCHKNGKTSAEVLSYIWWSFCYCHSSPKSFKDGIQSACIWVGSYMGANILLNFDQYDEFTEKNTVWGCSLFLLAAKWSINCAKWNQGADS